MIVVEATVLADLLFGEGARREAVMRLQGLDPEWICLALARYEGGNVAWKMAKIAGVDPAALRLGLDGIEEALVRMEDKIEMLAVFEIAVRHGVTFYDASHVWLASSLGLPLYSRDRKLAAACPQVVRPMPSE